jgi:hypothetical protein
VAHRHAVLLLNGLLEDIAKHPGFYLYNLAVRVKAQQLVEITNVEHNAAAYRQRGAGDVAASGGNR